MTVQNHESLFVRSFGNQSGPEGILLIPGGPGISGKYLDGTAQSLALRKKDVEVGTLTLPNHDEAKTPGTPPDFRSVLEQTSRALSSFHKNHHQKITLIGHSYGAFLLLALADQGLLPKGARLILLNSPTHFGSHPKFGQRLQELKVDGVDNFTTESEFQAWWKRASDAYFASKPTAKVKKMLSEVTYLMGAVNYSNGQPEFLNFNHRKISADYQIDFIEAKFDYRSPEKNIETIQSLYPNSLITLVDTGHFPMIEKPQEFLGILEDLIK